MLNAALQCQMRRENVIYCHVLKGVGVRVILTGSLKWHTHAAMLLLKVLIQTAWPKISHQKRKAAHKKIGFKRYSPIAVGRDQSSTQYTQCRLAAW